MGRFRVLRVLETQSVVGPQQGQQEGAHHPDHGPRQAGLRAHVIDQGHQHHGENGSPKGRQWHVGMQHAGAGMPHLAVHLMGVGLGRHGNFFRNPAASVARGPLSAG
jgi:hypothetical protein